ncbi:MAG: SDR family oxidoreductase [Alteromonadaceae bacterium]|nr:SDR family oxidoreductase [Alteromonadaceae bacterium]
MMNESWVLVTGGAQRIGAFFNQQLAKSGKNIVLHYNQSETAALTLKTQLERENIQVVLWQANLNDPDTIQQRFSKLLTQVSHIELLINNASVFEQGSLLETSLEQIQRNLNIHLTSPWLLIQALVKQNMPCQIINVLDANLSHLYTSKSAYFIAKKALETLTELASIECAPNVRVNAIAPGFVFDAKDTQNTTPANTQIENKDINILQRKVPLDDLYSAIELLMKNNSITGQTIQIDGGSHLQCPQYMLKN